MPQLGPVSLYSDWCWSRGVIVQWDQRLMICDYCELCPIQVSSVSDNPTVHTQAFSIYLAIGSLRLGQSTTGVIYRPPLHVPVPGVLDIPVPLRHGGCQPIWTMVHIHPCLSARVIVHQHSVRRELGLELFKTPTAFFRPLKGECCSQK